LVPDCVLIGGGGKDCGLAAMLSEVMGTALRVPEEPQIAAAVGAALFLRARSENGPQPVAS
jgi:activator of 2-hydroxyglutaryl-CoA dehydratase